MKKFALILPKQSLSENIQYHILEHLILSKLKQYYQISGFVTNDYLFFYGYSNLNINLIIKLISNFSFTLSEIQKEIEEIKIEESIIEEGFNDFIWENTVYSEHPCGTTKNHLSQLDKKINNIKNSIILNSIAYYQPINRLKKIRKTNKLKLFSDNDVLFKRIDNFKGKNFKIIYFKSHFDYLYLICEIYKVISPQKTILYKSKRFLSCLVFEANFKFSKKKKLKFAFFFTKLNLKRKIKRIKNDFFSTAQNQLESVLYDKKNWIQKIYEIESINFENVKTIINEIENYAKRF